MKPDVLLVGVSPMWCWPKIFLFLQKPLLVRRFLFCLFLIHSLGLVLNR